MQNEINQEIKNIYTDDYPYWLKTRCKYAKALPQGILASLQPSKSAIEREYLNSPICSFLNASIALNRELNPNDFKLFAIVYYKRDATNYYRSIDSDFYNIKMACIVFDLSPSGVYKRAHTFAMKCYGQAIATLELNYKLDVMLENKDFKFNSLN